MNDTAILTITGFAEAGRHAVVNLDTWQGHAPVAMIPHRQEGIEPLAFYRTGNQRMGHLIDLNGQLNGNLKTRRASFF